MIGFREYWQLTEGVTYNKTTPRGTMKSVTQIDDHFVSVFHEPSFNNKGHYDTHFEVNGRAIRSAVQVSHHTKQKILLHVGHAIDHFVREHKPTALHLYANEHVKDDMYHHFSKVLAKRHNGHVESDSQGSFSIHFPDHK